MEKEKMNSIESGLLIQQKGSFYRMSLTADSQEEVGTVAFAEFPFDQVCLKKGDLLLSVEGDKAVSEFLAPFPMQIKRWNKEIEENPELLNSLDPEENWIVDYTTPET